MLFHGSVDLHSKQTNYVLLITRPEVKMQGKINETFPAESFALFYIVVFCNIN